MIYKAIVFLPLIGFLIAGLFGRQIGSKASEYVTSGLMIIAAILSWIVFFNVALHHGEAGEVIKVPVMQWMQSGGIDVEWAFRIDTLSAIMFVVVNTVSTLVHLYSIGYMPVSYTHLTLPTILRV